jgi:hypothetical protein
MIRVRWVLGMLATAGCSSPFAAGPLFVEDDAGQTDDGYSAPDRSPDSGENLEAAVEGGVDATPETSAAEASIVDAPVESCAPHAIDAGGCFDGLYESNAFPVWVSGIPDAGCGGSSTYATPTACLCDYTCACLFEQAQGACTPNGGWGSCSDEGGVPIVVCAN